MLIRHSLQDPMVLAHTLHMATFLLSHPTLTRRTSAIFVFARRVLWGCRRGGRGF